MSPETKQQPENDIVHMTINMPVIKASETAAKCKTLIWMLQKVEKFPPERRDQAYEIYVESELLENGWNMVDTLKDTIDHYQSIIEELESRLPTLPEKETE